MTIFGAMISDDVVEDAVCATLEKWTPTYLTEIERQRGLDPGYYQRPVQYTIRTDFDKFPEEMLPLVVITSPGIADDPDKRGSGKVYGGRFQISVTCIVSAADHTSARRFAAHLGAAVRGALLQHQSLDQNAEVASQGVDWVAERNNDLPDDEDGSRTIRANRQGFLIDVEGVVSKFGGPRNPDPPDDPDVPHPDWPTVVEGGTHVKLEKEPVIDA